MKEDTERVKLLKALDDIVDTDTIEMVPESVIADCTFLFECLDCNKRWTDYHTPSVCGDCGSDEVWVPLDHRCQNCGSSSIEWKCDYCGSKKVTTPLWQYSHVECEEKDSKYVKDFLKGGKNGKRKNKI